MGGYMGEISASRNDTLKDRGSSRAQLRPGSFPSGTSERSAIQVLLADDDPVMIESLTGLLTEWGYDPKPVRTGREALDRLTARNGPSLAVLDWMLPDLYGTEICRRLPPSKSFHRVHIILLTGRDESTD